MSEYNEFDGEGYLGSIQDLMDYTGLKESAIRKIIKEKGFKPEMIMGKKYYYGDKVVDELERHKPRPQSQTSKTSKTGVPLNFDEEYEKRISHLEENVDRILDRLDRLEHHMITIVKKVQEVLEV